MLVRGPNTTQKQHNGKSIFGRLYMFWEERPTRATSDDWKSITSTSSGDSTLARLRLRNNVIKLDAQ